VPRILAYVATAACWRFRGGRIALRYRAWAAGAGVIALVMLVTGSTDATGNDDASDLMLSNVLAFVGQIRARLPTATAAWPVKAHTFVGAVQVLPSLVLVSYRLPSVPLPIRMTGPVQSPEGGLVISNSVSFQL
jgi:predicted component of type VI protein secretion system